MSSDIRNLIEEVVKTQVTTYGGTTNVFISGDSAQRTHPCVAIKATAVQEEVSPGSGVFNLRVEVDCIFKVSGSSGAAQTAFVQAVRQAFYRNDLDARPMVSLAKQLTAAGLGLTVFGVVPKGEGPVGNDGDDREYVYGLVFEMHATPTT